MTDVGRNYKKGGISLSFGSRSLSYSIRYTDRDRNIMNKDITTGVRASKVGVRKEVIEELIAKAGGRR
jgi:hypothetical protein